MVLDTLQGRSHAFLATCIREHGAETNIKTYSFSADSS